ncbi:MAG TPA: hypothetical protein ENJ54_04145 [Chloroflexi bacterium]|nr:hypothetical protein [Chloroflexota bacterium]
MTASQRFLQELEALSDTSTSEGTQRLLSVLRLAFEVIYDDAIQLTKQLVNEDNELPPEIDPLLTEIKRISSQTFPPREKGPLTVLEEMLAAQINPEHNRQSGQPPQSKKSRSTGS